MEHLLASEIVLKRNSDKIKWGFQLKGGDSKPITVDSINKGSVGEESGLRKGDAVMKINGQSTKNLSLDNGKSLIKAAGNDLTLSVWPYKIEINRSSANIPWGIKLDHGKGSGKPLSIGMVSPGGTADTCGVKTGDVIIKINEASANDMSVLEGQGIIKAAGNKFSLSVGSSENKQNSDTNKQKSNTQGETIALKMKRDNEKTPWGMKFEGGQGTGKPITAKRVANGTADKCGLKDGDIVMAINNKPTTSSTVPQAQDMVKSSGLQFTMSVKREASDNLQKSLNSSAFASSDNPSNVQGDTIVLKMKRDDAKTPWGMKFEGGQGTGKPISAKRVANGTADKCGLKDGDIVMAINNKPTTSSTVPQAQDMVKSSGLQFTMSVKRETSDTINKSQNYPVPVSSAQLPSQDKGDTIVLKMKRDNEKTPWGMKFEGGQGTGKPITTKRVENGTADKCGLKDGDIVVAINNIPTTSSTVPQAQNMVKSSGLQFTMSVKRSESEKVEQSQIASTLDINKSTTNQGDTIVLKMKRDNAKTPWGMKFEGGQGTGKPIKAQRVANGTADKCGLKDGDIVMAINNKPTTSSTVPQAQDMVKSSGLQFTMSVKRETSDAAPEKHIRIEEKSHNTPVSFSDDKPSSDQGDTIVLKMKRDNEKTPWGMKFEGGQGTGKHITTKKAPNGTADKCGLKDGDIVVAINNKPTTSSTVPQAQDMVKSSGLQFTMSVKRPTSEKIIPSASEKIKPSASEKIKLGTSGRIKSKMGITPVIINMKRDNIKTPWGMKFENGVDTGKPLSIIRVDGGVADKMGVQNKDVVIGINDIPVKKMATSKVQDLVKSSGLAFKLVVSRDTPDDVDNGNDEKDRTIKKNEPGAEPNDSPSSSMMQKLHGA